MSAPRIDPDSVAGPVPAAELEALATVDAPDLRRSGPGRETFLWRLASGEQVVVKRYRGRERSLRDALHVRLEGGPPRSPGRVEFDNLRSLGELGIPSPGALACYERGDLSLVVMQRIEHAEDLRQRLARRPSEGARFFEGVFQAVDRLHEGGWYHRDLYLDHFLVRSHDGAPILIDVGRARRDAAPRLRWFVKDLAALLHSTPPALRGRRALRFLARWLDRRGIEGRRQRRRVARAVIAKERRMAAHEPRGGTSHRPRPGRGGQA